MLTTFPAWQPMRAATSSFYHDRAARGNVSGLLQWAMSMQEFEQWIMPAPALDVWRVAKGLDFSPLAWRVYDQALERGEFAIRLWQPRVWDASGPEAAALGAMGSDYKAAIGWIKVSDLGGVSCHCHGLAASADDWDQVRAGWWKLIGTVAGLPLADAMLGAGWWMRDVMLDRETVDQNVEPIFRYQAEILEGVTLTRSMLADGRVQYDMFKKLIGAPPPDYKPGESVPHVTGESVPHVTGESVPHVPGGALVRLQLSRLGDHRTRIDAWAKGINRNLDRIWLPNIMERFVLYLYHLAGVTVDAPTGGAPMAAGDGAGAVKRGPHEGKLELWAKFKAIKDENPTFSRRQVAIKASTEDTQYTEAQVRYGFQQMGWEWVSGYEAR